MRSIGSDSALFRCVQDVDGGGLMFMEKEQRVLTELLGGEIPDAFYYYWNDAVNTFGYSSKLLIMFSALEALARKRDKKTFKKQNDLYEEILGPELSKEMFADTMGLRQRLTHGEYFNGEDSQKNYLKLIHNKVISYFNRKVLSDRLLDENIVNPQRHFWGNKIQGTLMLKHRDNNHPFNLKDMLKDFSENNFNVPERYEQIFNYDLSTY